MQLSQWFLLSKTCYPSNMILIKQAGLLVNLVDHGKNFPTLTLDENLKGVVTLNVVKDQELLDFLSISYILKKTSLP